MANWLIKQTVDLEKPDARGQDIPAALMYEADAGAHLWRVTVLASGQPADLTGYAAGAYFERADGVTVAVGGTIAGNVVEVLLERPCYQYAGALRGTLTLTGNAENITISAVTFYVKIRDGETVLAADPSAQFVRDAATLDREVAALTGAGAELAGRVTVAEGRIDGIIALPDGSTTADAELKDIRVGGLGTNYASAGAAVRGQAQALNKKIDLADADLAAAGMTTLAQSWRLGSINATTGLPTTPAESNRARTLNYIDLSAALGVVATGGAEVGLRAYGTTDQTAADFFKGYTGWSGGFVRFAEALAAAGITGANYVRVVARWADGRDIGSLDLIGACVTVKGAIISTPDLAARIAANDAAQTAYTDAVRGDLAAATSPLAGGAWTLGTIIANGDGAGTSAPADNRIRQLDFTPLADLLQVYSDPEAEVGLRFYSDADKDAYLGFTLFAPGAQDVAAASAAYPAATHVRFVARWTSDGAVTDVAALAEHIRVSGPALTTVALSERIANLELVTDTTPMRGMTYEHGGIRVQDGAETTPENLTRARSRFAFPRGMVYSIRAAGDAEFSLRFYREGAFVGHTGLTWLKEIDPDALAKLYPDADSVRVVGHYSDDSDITDLLAFSRLIEMECTRPVERVALALEPGNVGTARPTYVASADRSRMRHKYLIPVGKLLYINPRDGYLVTYRCFDAGKNLVYSADWETGPVLLSRESGYAYIFLIACRADNEPIDVDEMHAMERSIAVWSVGAEAEDDYRVELSVAAHLPDPAATSPRTPALVAVKYKHAAGRQPVPVGYLYRDVLPPYGFYWSGDGRDLTWIFDWDETQTDTGAREPHEYCFTVTAEGDVLCVYRGELGWATGGALRADPIVYPHGDYANPARVRFAANEDAPTSWLMNCGVFVEEGAVYFGEYTRFTHNVAHVWKVSAPYSGRANWTSLREFELSHEADGFKHVHMIERDPYTGILWLTTGDKPPAPGSDHVGTPGIYYSTDDGANWTTLLEGVEKYCRQLNFIWTEDYVYWSSDTTDYEGHWFIQARRDANGVIDMDTVEDLFHFFGNTATYHVCYCEHPRGLLCLERFDSKDTAPLNIYFWDIEREKMLLLDRADLVGESMGGFRVEAMNHYPALDGGYLCGFSLCSNYLDGLGNSYNSHMIGGGYTATDAYNADCVNNLRLRIVRRNK